VKRALFDTSILVAAVVKAHPAHARALPWFKRAKSGEISMIVSSHTLAELYAVLTTLPVSPRISPDIAWSMLHENILGTAEISALSPTDYKAAIRDMKEGGFSGGIIYDALICSSAIKAHAEIILTLNGSDFRRLPATKGLKVIEP
jgi:predicted nucleic acid-binding protein